MGIVLHSFYRENLTSGGFQSKRNLGGSPSAKNSLGGTNPPRFRSRATQEVIFVGTNSLYNKPNNMVYYVETVAKKHWGWLYL